METKERALELYKKGFSQASISRMLNVSRQRISQIVNNYGTLQKQIKTPGMNYRTDIKTVIFRRDKYKCQWCNSPYHRRADLQVHHIDIDSKNNSLDNLITLCKKCHRKFHTLERQEKSNKEKLAVDKKINITKISTEL